MSFENFSKFTGKHLCRDLCVGLRLQLYLKRRHQNRCIPVNFGKLLIYIYIYIYIYICLPAEGAKNISWPWLYSSEIGVVWLWHLLVKLHIWLTTSSCYGSTPLTLELIERDGGLSTLCHSCGFACQQRVLKTFLAPGYLHSENGVVWLWHI